MTSIQTRHTLVAAEDSKRLDLWLHDQFPTSSRSMLQRLIKDEHVRLRGSPCKSNSIVRAGDQIEIHFPPMVASHLEPEAIPLEILFEDESLLVVNKPAGLVVHPGAGHATHTLVHALLHHCRGQLSGIGGVERPGIVHRLDKETSGCLVVAKTDQVHRSLIESFQSRTMEKIYLALVWGHPRFLADRIDQPIGRHPTHRHKMAISEKGRTAVTEWKVIKRFEKISLLECRIQTGRTHQIRVHLASIGHPVVGDATYGKLRKGALPKTPTRQMLHAWRLTFDHPVHGKKIACEAPLPEDMEELM